MSTFQVRIEDYVGTIADTTALSDQLTAGARWLLDLLPEEKADRYTTAIADAGSGVSVASYKLYGAYKSGYRAQFIDPEEYARYADVNSRFYATSITPVAYILNGTLFIKPGGGSGRGIAYPTVLYGDSSITGFPIEWEQAVILYTAVQQALIKLADAEADAELSYTNWVTYTETNKDIELGDAELRKLQLQLEEARTSVDVAKSLSESLNNQLKNLLTTIGVK